MTSEQRLPRRIGRYALHGVIAAGGMATVHFGRLLGPVGFSRTVAIKRLHSLYASDPEFVSMFLDEARLAARIRHPNVVPTLDVVAAEGELFVVMDYIQGESLASLLRGLRAREERVPPRVGISIVSGVLQGLHAAHEAKDERGTPLGIVHRDVSPQNVIVGVDGLPRVLDFGVAKAAVRLGTTRDGKIKGKLAYMAPEQMQSEAVTRKADIYAASVMLWEVLTGQKLFKGDTEAVVLARILGGDVQPPSEVVKGLPKALDAVVLRGLARNPDDRFATAREMALALERTISAASAAEVGQWLEQVAGKTLAERATIVADIESDSGTGSVPNISAAIAEISSGSKPDLQEMLPPTAPEFEPMRKLADSVPRLEEHNSQLSHVSVFTGGSGPPRRSSPLALIGIVLGTAIVVAGSYIAYQRIGTAAPAAAHTAPVPPPLPAPPPAIELPATSTATATATAAPTTASTATTATTAAATTTAVATSTPRAPTPRPKPTGSASKGSAFSGLGGRD